jgi:hypothetical protein
LRGTASGSRGHDWTWKRPDVFIQVFARINMVSRLDLENAGVIFDDEAEVTSSTDGESDGLSSGE